MEICVETYNFSCSNSGKKEKENWTSCDKYWLSIYKNKLTKGPMRNLT